MTWYFFSDPLLFLPIVVHSALPICLFEPAIRPLAVVVIFTARSTACVDLDNMGKVVA